MGFEWPAVGIGDGGRREGQRKGSSSGATPVMVAGTAGSEKIIEMDDDEIGTHWE